jgi:C1A family cysteine protease
MDEDDCRGALKSPPDSRDWVFEQLTHGRDGRYLVDLPESYDLRAHTQPVRDQGDRGTCASFGGAAIKEVQEKRKGKFDGWMSPEFIYYYRDNKPASGMYGRNVFQVLQKIGSVPEHLYKYETGDNKTSPPSRKLLTKASNYRISNYARVDTVEGVKRALIELGPCYVSLPLYQTRPKFWMPSDNEKCSGGHAAVIVGYTEEGFILRNSWGSDWNGDGHIVYPYSEWNRHWDCWVSIDAPSKTKNKNCIIV